MTMDCRRAKTLIEKRADGLLPPGAEAELDAHLSSCRECAVDQSCAIAMRQLLRSHIDIRTASAQSGLDVMLTRVRAGIEEKKTVGGVFGRRIWATLPVGVLTIMLLAFLFYPAGPDRSPFNPKTFEVSVEDMESDTAVVTQLNMGEGLPQVIWITEDADS